MEGEIGDADPGLVELERRLEERKQLLSEKQEEVRAHAQTLVAYGVMPHPLQLRLRNITPVWYTERTFPPWELEVIDQSTGARYLDANHWNVTVRVLDGRGLPVPGAFTMQELSKRNGPAKRQAGKGKVQGKGRGKAQRRPAAAAAKPKGRKRKYSDDDSDYVDEGDEDDDEEGEGEGEEGEDEGEDEGESEVEEPPAAKGRAKKGQKKGKKKGKKTKPRRAGHSEVHARLIHGRRVFSGLSFDRISSKAAGYFQIEAVVVPPPGCNVTPSRLGITSRRLQIKSCRLFSQDKEACKRSPDDPVSKLPRLNEVHEGVLRQFRVSTVADLAQHYGNRAGISEFARRINEASEQCSLEENDLRQAVATARLVVEGQWSRRQRANLLRQDDDDGYVLHVDQEDDEDEDEEFDSVSDSVSDSEERRD